MEKMNIDEVLKLYEDLSVIVNQLNEKTPLLLEKYDKIGAELEAALSEIEQEKEETIESISTNVVKAETTSKRLTDEHEAAMQTIERLAEINGKIDILTEKMTLLERRMQTVEKGLPAEIDYDEKCSLGELYEKYNGSIDGPVVVRRIGWSNDYCFAIDSVAGNTVNGREFKDGKLYRAKSTRPYNETMYKMYSGKLPV